MRVFLTGASGAIGSRLVPQLIAAGHEVTGTHSSPSSAGRLQVLGANPVRLDLLDARAVREAVLEAEPDAIVHEATALADVKFRRNMDKVTAKTNELRTTGTDALLAAAREGGVQRFVAQSVASFSRYAREGGPVKTEDDPLDPAPREELRGGAAAMAYLEQAVTDFGGIALRYGVFYGAANDGMISLSASASFRSWVTAAASGPGSSSTTLQPQPSSRWSTMARRSTTSSTTNLPRCGNGCRCSPSPCARSHRGTSPPGSRGCSRVIP